MRVRRGRAAFGSLAGGALVAVLGLAGCVLGLAGCSAGGHVSGAGVGAARGSQAVGSASGSGAESAQVAATTGAAGTAVPAGVSAQSVSFVSPATGFVLAMSPDTAAPHTVVLRTTDGGAHWTLVGAPPLPVGSALRPGLTVWGIRFASPSRGFVYGRGLFSTTDGGEHWASIPLPGGQPVQSLAVSDGQVLALGANCTLASCPQPSSAGLYRRALSGGTWREVVSLPGYDGLSRADVSDLVAVRGAVAAVLDGTQVVVTGDDGLTVSRHPTPCTRPGYVRASVVAVLSSRMLALVCDGQGSAGNESKTVYLSGDLGARWRSAGSPPAAGSPVAIAGVPGHLVVAASGAADSLYYSTRDGHWARAYTQGDGGLGFAGLGFAGPSLGVVVYAPPQGQAETERPGRLLVSGDGGAHWHAVRWTVIR